VLLKYEDMLNQIAGFDANALRHPRKKTHGVKVGHVQVGGGAPIVVQSMTNTDTADVESTLQQTLQLAEAGSELVRWTVNVPEAADAVAVIKKRLLDAGCGVPIIGDFHYNGHVLLRKHPECAKALDKYRINPGNVGAGQRRDEQFLTICKVAVDHGKPVRIGVNGGSLNQELVMRKMQENTDSNLGKESEEIINDCMVISALESTELALESGLRQDQIIISCKTSRPRDLIAVYWRHDSYFADPETRRRPPRRDLCLSRTAAVPRAAFVFAERYGLPRLRPDDQHDLSGTGRTHSGLHPRHDARVENAVRRRRNDDPRGDGLHRERPGRIQSRQHRY